jgi:hypothetical protein
MTPADIRSLRLKRDALLTAAEIHRADAERFERRAAELSQQLAEVEDPRGRQRVDL